MSQFDSTTEKKSEEFAKSGAVLDKNEFPYGWGFQEGRNSAKESLEILARFVEAAPRSMDLLHEAQQAIAAVKARGDWPLGDA